MRGKQVLVWEERIEDVSYEQERQRRPFGTAREKYRIRKGEKGRAALCQIPSVPPKSQAPNSKVFACTLSVFSPPSNPLRQV